MCPRRCPVQHVACSEHFSDGQMQIDERSSATSKQSLQQKFTRSMRAEPENRESYQAPDISP